MTFLLNSVDSKSGTPAKFNVGDAPLAPGMFTHTEVAVSALCCHLYSIFVPGSVADADAVL